MVADTKTIGVVLNGKALETAARNVCDLVQERGLANVKVATAVNGHFVPTVQRATTFLQPGDRVEIVSPRQGG